MGIPLSRVLVDFSAGKIGPAPKSGSPIPVIPVSEPVKDIATQLAEAHARGADEAWMSADAELERKLAEALAHADEQRAAERQRWTCEQADALAARLTSAVEALEARIGEAVGRVLTPFLTDELRGRSVEALAESIGTLLSGASRPALRVSGPEDLLAALRKRLGDVAATVEWEPNGQVDVTLSADDSVIETEIQGWIDCIAGAGR